MVSGAFAYTDLVSTPPTTCTPCIYCGATSLPRLGREHVIPQALGMFEQNWVLTDVCDDCNRTFGRELDLPLTRDGVEGYLRLETGQKPASGAKELRNRRMTATWKVDGQLDGARVLFGSTEEGDQILPIPPAQVHFRRPGEDWVILTERELTPQAVAKAGAGTDVEVKVFAESGPLDRFRQKHNAVGFDLTETGGMTFFNRITYAVLLLHNESDEWVSVCHRHLLDPFKRTIEPMAFEE